ncbi:MAG: malate/lactate/ureidoglycolate dehydrogenase [Alphaproteobacteria bacterium]|jgi:uncharacterized oxidoreductase
MPVIAAPALTEIAFEIVRHTGSEAAEARTVAEHLVGANLAGHDSHGVGMLSPYMKNFHAGLLIPNTAPTAFRDAGPFLQFEGGKGYGQRVAADAMAAAIERCREVGITVMTLRNSHHIGRVGTYGEMALAAGFISLHFVNVTDHRAIVVPHRGREARFGTNPVCIAMPTSNPDEPVLLDMATSKVAMGKLRVAWNAGKQVEPGLAVDANGDPTTDPALMFTDPPGSLVPFAEHKGYGLALMAELLSGVLSAGGTLQPGNERLDGIINTMTVFVLDPARLGDIDWMRAEVDAMLEYAKSSRPVDPAEPVLTPGEPERRRRAERGRDGIELSDQTWALIREAGESVGFDPAEANRLAGS